jgi:hypothetical protein
MGRPAAALPAGEATCLRPILSIRCQVSKYQVYVRGDLLLLATCYLILGYLLLRLGCQPAIKFPQFAQIGGAFGF